MSVLGYSTVYNVTNTLYNPITYTILMLKLANYLYLSWEESVEFTIAVLGISGIRLNLMV